MADSNGTATVVNMFYLGLPQGSNITVSASVVAANPTATTYSLGCMAPSASASATDSSTGSQTTEAAMEDPEDCSDIDQTVTVGPWLLPSAPVATGVYDGKAVFASDSITYSYHCDMTSLAPAACTVFDFDAGNNVSTSMVYTDLKSDDATRGWGYAPLTITAGMDKLASLSAGASTTGTASATSTAAASASGSMMTASASASRSGTASGSSSAASASGTANAAAHFDAGLGSLTLAGLVVAWLLR